MNAERIVAFPKMTSGALSELSGLGKLIVMIVTKNKLDEDPKEERYDLLINGYVFQGIKLVI